MKDLVIGMGEDWYYCNKCGRSHYQPEICPFVSKGMRSIGCPMELMSQLKELFRNKRLNVGKTIQRGKNE